MRTFKWLWIETTRLEKRPPVVAKEGQPIYDDKWPFERRKALQMLVASLGKNSDEKAVVKSREDEMVAMRLLSGLNCILLSEWCCCSCLTYLTSILTLVVELGSTFRLFTSEKKLKI